MNDHVRRLCRILANGLVSGHWEAESMLNGAEAELGIDPARERLDCRLSGLAKKFGGFYTRYADDLVFSGDRYFQNRLS